MITDLKVDELEAVRRRHHDDSLVGLDSAVHGKLQERGQGHTGLRAAKEPVAVCSGRGLGQFILRRLLDDTIELTEDGNCSGDADRIADLNGGCQGTFCHDRLDLFESGEIATVEGICPFGLRAHEAGQFLDYAQVAHHQEPEANGGDVAKVSAGHDDPVGNLPVELLHHLNTYGLLPFDAMGVHRVDQRERQAIGEYGEAMAIAFQIRDDLLNLLSTEEDEGKAPGVIGGAYGKERGGDIAEGKRTLIIIDLLEKCAPAEREQILAILHSDRCDTSQKDIDRVIDMAQDYGAVAYAEETGKRKADESLAHLELLPAGPSRDRLREMLEFFVRRAF